MKTAIITGSNGLVGAEAARHYLGKGHLVVGIDDDLRATFFGAEASTRWQRDRLVADYENYRHIDADIRDAAAFDAFHQAPRPGEVYNMGGSRHSNCSMQEAIAICEAITGNKMSTVYVDDNRIGDHVWWVSSVEKFKADYPSWRLTYDAPAILNEIASASIENQR